MGDYLVEFWALNSFDLMAAACIFSLGCLCGYAFRGQPVRMPSRDRNGRFLPWKRKETIAP